MTQRASRAAERGRPGRDIPLKVLLVAGFLLSGLLPVMIVALMGLSVARDELTHQALLQLESVRDLKKMQLERYFAQRKRQIAVLAQDPYLRRALGEFSALFAGPRALSRTALRGHGHGRFTAPPRYLAVHAEHARFFRAYVSGHDYYDLFLMAADDGYTLFTVTKESDFGVPISTVESSLRDVWQIAAKQHRVALSDARPYAPSRGQPAQFVTAPVRDGGATVGVVAVQISLDAIAKFMSARPGMGDSGVAYLVGRDFRMRFDSTFDRGSDINTHSARGDAEARALGPAVAKALSGVVGTGKVPSAHGSTALAAYAPVRFGSTTWAIVAEIDEIEIESKIAQALNGRITLIIVLSLVLLLILAFSISLFISSGIARVNTELNLLMDGVLKGERHLMGDPERVGHDFRPVVRKTNELIRAYHFKDAEGRRLAEAVGHNQRLEAVGTLAGGIAHDFNNILAYMMTYGDLVLDTLEPGSPSHAHMEQILGGIDRATELVAQIMTFGRRLEGQRRLVEVAPVVSEAAKLLEATIPKSIRVRCRVEDAQVRVMADPSQVHQIVMNLCTNALHAMLDGGGEMVIALSRVTPSDAERRELPDLGAGDHCVLSVSDSGCGIPPKTKERIFEPFFTTKPVGQGSGMGLAVVHGIVASHDGAIAIDSEVGRGTTVRVYLPAIGGTVLDDAPAGRLIGGKGRLLVVDDEPQICASMALMLDSLGYQVETHSDAAAAVSAFAAAPKRFDAVISDINMPTLDGFELLRRVRACRAEVPVVLITGYDELDAAAEVVEGYELLLKPFKRSELSELLARLLEANATSS